ncbi:helix-turn-helix and ligand-binding sensor domain-containing protein [Christiangramia portivictoriae]|uniref:helix-turn-helix and ligand-binding sensor domain-containing protein n=1 Tax=Christiangramia portivictoriae TaxID=326069 RepID=UPI000412EDD1|nr:LuxR C-terminal-related transcriptional regulator [Christiangramia portivictoriae]
MKTNIINLLITIILTVVNAYSQELLPPIQNFKPSVYDAASQNWDIAVDDRGVIFAANNQGLLEYDGLSWELHKLESGSIIRSVLPVGERVYTGSYREFGYWKTDAKGQLIYHSLGKLLNKLELQSDEFWSMEALGETIYFRSFGGVFKYKNNEIIKVQNHISTAMETFQGRLIIAERGKGIYLLKSDDSLEELEGDLSALEGLNIIELFAFGDTLYIGSKNAVFIYSEGELSKLNDIELNNFLQESELNHILGVSNNKLLIGTIKNGVAEYDLVSKNLKFFNRIKGLQNNTVLGMSYHHGNLWLALDKGIDKLDLESPVEFFTDHSGELGAVYDIEMFEDNIYLASNTGVHTFKDGNLKLLDGSQDHVWNLEVLNNQLFVNHNTGIYKVKNASFNPVKKRTGSFCIEKVPGKDNLYLVGEYTGISTYDERSQQVSELEGINFPVKQIVFENDQVFWAAHPYEGLYRITHDNFQNIEVEKFPVIGKEDNYRVKLYHLNGQIICYVNGKWYRYNPFKVSFEVFTEFEELRGLRLLQDAGNFSIFNNEENGALLFTDFKELNLRFSSDRLGNRLVKANENVIMVNDSVYYITLNDGFAKLNLVSFQKDNSVANGSSAFIKKFTDNHGIYDLNSTPTLQYRTSGNIQVQIGAPDINWNQLSYKLKGEEEYRGEVGSDGWLTLRNLSYGDYALEIVHNRDGEAEEVLAKYEFGIAPPWYLSAWIKAFYVLLFIVLIVMVFLINRRKLKKHQQQLEEKFEEEHQERLARIEHDRLVNEIDLKRKELANTTMMAAKKNEVLMEIQSELSKDKNSFSNQYRMKHIMNKINAAVKSKDEWKVFETNFNEVHEDFFKDILAEYPKLSSKDLKLCSYLKMNLSSKEIAPLMGISVRGVEVHRYRLRKKMALESDVNLTKFLIKNF